MGARPGTRCLARFVPVCGLLCGVLLAGTALPTFADAPAKQKIHVRSLAGEPEQTVAEIVAAVLDGPGTDGLAQKVGNVKDFSVQGDDVTVVVAFDLDLLAAPRAQATAGPPEEKVANAVAGHRLVGGTKIREQAVVALSPVLSNVLAGGGRPVSTVAELAGVLRTRPDKPPILVIPRLATAYGTALAELGLSVNRVEKPEEFDKTVRTPGFDAAALVPENDPLLVRGGGGGVLLPLQDPEGRMSRTLTVLASERLAERDPEAGRLLGKLTERLTPDAVQQVRQQAKSGGLATAAREWARKNELVRRTTEPTTSSPNENKENTEQDEPVPKDTGFSWTSLLLALVAGGGLAGLLLWKLGWRPVMAGAPARHEVTPPESPAGPTHQYRVRPGAPPVPSAAAGPLVVGPAPRPIAVHLPRQATSADCGLALDGGLLGGLTVRAASVRGRAHGFRGENRQDAYGLRLSGDEQWVIAAVADGLGSARHADAASIAAVRAALDAADNALRSGPPTAWDWRPLITYVSEQIRQATAGLGPARRGTNTDRTPSAAPGSTLTVAVLPAEGPGVGVCAAVGDSPALLVAGGRWRAIAGAPHASGLSDNLTTALPGDPGNVEVRTFDWGHGDLLILTSDGFAAGVAGGSTPLARRLAETWRTPPSLTEFVREVDFRLSTFDDDRTVVALWAGRHDTAVR